MDLIIIVLCLIPYTTKIYVETKAVTKTVTKETRLNENMYHDEDAFMKLYNAIMRV